MNGRLRLWWRRSRRDDGAAQIVEFAVALPLLMVFVVGIFDFSGAFTLKQKLTNAARDAARTAAADPISDLSAALPMSVNDAFYTIDTYLVANKINDCGITQSTSPSGLTWTSTSTGGGCPPGGLKIIINRGYYFPSTSTQPAAPDCSVQALGGQTAVLATCVSIQYVYAWRFGSAASLLGRTASLPNPIAATAVAMNEN
ncbi:MAG TPA: TadE family protein [Candidatus Sulfotelmatobacter sp.]|nr:TadE family protein [Candidatus Sulfotelmatobacter sp.]